MVRQPGRLDAHSSDASGNLTNPGAPGRLLERSHFPAMPRTQPTFEELRQRREENERALCDADRLIRSNIRAAKRQAQKARCLRKINRAR